MAVFVPNLNFAREFAEEPETIEGMEGEASTAIEYAKAFAPVATGDYRDGLEVRVVDDEVYLVGTDWKSLWIEIGTSEPFPTPAFAPLRRGAQAAGLELADTE